MLWNEMVALIDCNDAIIDLNNAIADNPEVAWHEYNSSKLHVEFLRSFGVENVEYPAYGLATSYRAEIGDGKPTILLCAEYDALPDIGHGCGHCCHGAMSLLSFIALKNIIGEIGGRLIILGTPAEELSIANNTPGKLKLIDMGAFKDVDLAMMIHSTSGNRNVVKMNTTQLVMIEFKFEGKSAHAAANPWQGRSSSAANMLFFHAIDSMRLHIPSTSDSVHGIMTNGGSSPSIIPDISTSLFLIRSQSSENLDELKKWTITASKGCAHAMQTKVRHKVICDIKGLKHNRTALMMMEEIFRTLGLSLLEEWTIGGSTDMGNVSHICPAIHAGLSINNADIPLHSEEFANLVKLPEAHQAIRLGARIIAKSCMKYLTDKKLQKLIENEFKESQTSNQLI